MRTFKVNENFTVKEGNLLDMFDRGDFHAIAHGCNCFHSFGAGIAKEIKRRYPSTYKVDRTTAYGDYDKLGHMTTVHVGNSIIYNLYTQFRYGYGVSHCDCFAIENAFKEMIKHAQLVPLQMAERPFRIGIPLIGGGLAGGDISQLLELYRCTIASADVPPNGDKNPIHMTLVILPESKLYDHVVNLLSPNPLI